SDSSSESESEPESSTSGSDSDSSDSSSSSESDSDSESSSDELPKETQQLAKRQKEALAKLQQLEIGLEPHVATNLDLLQVQRQKQQASLDQQAQSRFREIYMDYVTTGFGADLDALRKDGAMDDEGLDVLVDALETGVLSFTASEQQMIIDEAG
ncbi:hypothetical protein H4R21_003197, partial [Coemansia helicoidea]